MDNQKLPPNISSELFEHDKKQTSFIGDLKIEYGHGISENDKLLANNDKNSVEFVLNYSKLWCKCLKDTIFSLEKRALYENEFMKLTGKLMQTLESNLLSVNGAPCGEEIIQMSRIMNEQAKEVELHNTKKCRELLEVLTRQKIEFAKTRKFLKLKWKGDVKKMLEAENALYKARSSYVSRCQTGVKLREELAVSQNSLNDLQATMPTLHTTTSPVTSTNQNTFSSASVSTSNSEASQEMSTVDPALMNQVGKQKSKVERLEKQLQDNDKKEIEQMYAYKEFVETANKRLRDLEKSKVEIICDIRLTVSKCDEVVSGTLSKLVNRLFLARTKMLQKFEESAKSFQKYQPCKPYQQLVETQIRTGTPVCIEKYQFEGYHDVTSSSSGTNRGEAPFGKFVSRFAQMACKEIGDPNEPFGGRGQLHSDSDSDQEEPTSATSLRGNGGGTVLSSLVEFGSNFFRADLKKSSARGVKQRTNAATGLSDNLSDPVAEDNFIKEYDIACYFISQCVNGIENQVDGLATLGMYRVPASKVKVAAVFEAIRPFQETLSDTVNLSDEHPLTLASAIKTKLIGLPEPLFTYNLYAKFVEMGKILNSPEQTSGIEEQIHKLNELVNQLPPAMYRIAGLLFHHLKRVSTFQATNQMGAVNLATMFGPTLLRQKPKFQIANMMEFVDNKWLMQVVAVCIERADDIFGSSSKFTTDTLLDAIKNTNQLETETSNAISIPTSQLRDTFFASPTNEIGKSNLSNSGLIGKPLPLYTPYSDTSSPFSMSEISSPKDHVITPNPDSLKVTFFGGGQRAISQQAIHRKPADVSPTPNSNFTSTLAHDDLVKSQPSIQSAGVNNNNNSVASIKRLVSEKAHNFQQHFQQLKALSSPNNTVSDSISPSRGVAALVIQHKPSRQPYTKKLSSASDQSEVKKIPDTINLTDCNYIDSEVTAF